MRIKQKQEKILHSIRNFCTYMKNDNALYRILIIEDDAIRFNKLQKMLHKRLTNAMISQNMHAVSTICNMPVAEFDIVLIDLSRRDTSGQNLRNQLAGLQDISKVIIISERNDLEFTSALLSIGVADYLYEKKLNSMRLCKSIVNVVERNKIAANLTELQRQNTDLFNLNPLPMWVYDVDTLCFTRVNEAAVRKYGYSREEFEMMTIRQIRPTEDLPILENAVEFVKNHQKLFSSGLYRHQTKCGRIITVELVSNIIYINDVKHELVSANDVTERVTYLQEIEQRNLRLQEIAFTQSHIVRAPLANMLGILHLIKDMGLHAPESSILLDQLLTCGDQLDNNIREIVKKSTQI